MQAGNLTEGKARPVTSMCVRILDARFPHYLTTTNKVDLVPKANDDTSILKAIDNMLNDAYQCDYRVRTRANHIERNETHEWGGSEKAALAKWKK